MRTQANSTARLLAAIVALFSVAVLVGCASLIGPRDVFVPLSKLQESVSQRFPVNRQRFKLVEANAHFTPIRITTSSTALTIHIEPAI